ncbi:MAG: hypothetical protein M3N37_04880 [Actinomycetota bacterium]|nr:hypothetical protein [Actinomycetota bacterium]
MRDHSPLAGGVAMVTGVSRRSAVGCAAAGRLLANGAAWITGQVVDEGGSRRWCA